MRFAPLNGDPLQLGQFVHGPLAAFAPHAGILDSAERSVRLVVNRGPVDVHGAGFQFQRASHRELQVIRDHCRRKAITRVIRQLDGIVGILRLDDARRPARTAPPETRTSTA